MNEDEDGNVTEKDCPECCGSGYFLEEVEDECTPDGRCCFPRPDQPERRDSGVVHGGDGKVGQPPGKGMKDGRHDVAVIFFVSGKKAITRRESGIAGLRSKVSENCRKFLE